MKYALLTLLLAAADPLQPKFGGTGVVSPTCPAGQTLVPNGSGAMTCGNPGLNASYVDAPLTGAGTSASHLGLSTPLGIAYGGTNTSVTPTPGGVCYGGGAGFGFPYAFSTAGTLNQCLLSGGSSTPTWADCGTINGVTVNSPLTGVGTSASHLGVQDASGSVSGVVNTTTQTFAGSKTFNGAIVSAGTGQAAGTGFSMPAQGGASGGAILLEDTNSAVNNGGVVIFSANGAQWQFAAIKGLITNGGGNSQGDIAFLVRPTATDATLTEAARIASSGKLTTAIASAGGLTQEAWTAVTFANGWGNFGSGLASAGFMKDSCGFVHIRGSVGGGSAPPSAVFTLSTGYRPAAQQRFAVESSTASQVGTVIIQTDGQVLVQTGSTVRTQLDGITFDTR